MEGNKGCNSGFVYCGINKIRHMKVRCKHTNLVFEVKRVRNSGKVELMNGVVVSHNEFNLNWEVVK